MKNTPLTKSLSQQLETLGKLEQDTKTMMDELGMVYLWPDETQIEGVKNFIDKWDKSIKIEHRIGGELFGQPLIVKLELDIEADIKTLIGYYQKKRHLNLYKISAQLEQEDTSDDLQELVVEAMIARSFGLTKKIMVMESTLNPDGEEVIIDKIGIVDLLLKNELVRIDHSSVINAILEGKYQLGKKLVREHVWLSRQELESSEPLRKEYTFTDDTITHQIQVRIEEL